MSAPTLHDLAPLPFWVAWREECRPGSLEKTKVPYSPRTGKKAEADDPATWADRRTAEREAQRIVRGDDLGGIGIEFGPLPDSPLSLGGIDLDTCRDPDTGEIEEWAAEFIRRFQTYAEISPSGSGVKLFFTYRTADLERVLPLMGGAENSKMFKWKVPKGEHPPGIELHLRRRYFTVTEQALEDCSGELQTVPAETLLWAMEAGARFVTKDPANKPNGDGEGRHTREDRAGPAGSDRSRSARAMWLASHVKRRGGDYEDFLRALAEDDEAAEWMFEKGFANGERELRRAWERAGTGTKPNGRAEQNAKSPNEPAPLRPVLAALPDPATIDPREWLLGNVAVRQYISVMVAPGGVGKTSYAIAACLSVITGRPILGEHVFVQTKAWLFNLEDPLVEIHRRVAAAQKHWGIARQELYGSLFLHSGRDRKIRIATYVSPHDQQQSRISFPDKDAIIEGAKADQIGLIVVDPFIRSHELDENSNPDMDAAATAWAEVAAEANCAVLLVHHTRKSSAGNSAGDIEASRGAKSLTDAGRVGLVMAKMTNEEADLFGVPREERQLYVRLDDGKANMAPPADKARWFRLASVALGNGQVNPLYPKGDNVQAIETWAPPSIWRQLSDADCNAVLDVIQAGLPGGHQFTSARTGKGPDTRWAGRLLVEMFALNETQAATVIATWLESGLLVKGKYLDPQHRKNVVGLTVNDARRPGR
jgi:hypothetical protein